MNSIKVISENNDYSIQYDGQSPKSGTINGQEFLLDLIQENTGNFHLIFENQSYNVELIKVDTEQKRVDLKLNGTPYSFALQDRFDELLERMGMGGMNEQKVTQLKAPMPGLVLNVAVNGGSEVKKGDPLLILEAMKMENVLKSPTDGIVKDITVKQGDAVEKNQLLLNFE